MRGTLDQIFFRGQAKQEKRKFFIGKIFLKLLAVPQRVAAYRLSDTDLNHEF